MNSAIRWRIVTLQAILVVILAAASGFLLFEGSFVTSMVHDELASQQISFPPASEIKAGGALDPAEFPAEIRQYAGQPLDNGDKAKAYANDFIGKHLQGVAGGLTTPRPARRPRQTPPTPPCRGRSQLYSRVRPFAQYF